MRADCENVACGTADALTTCVQSRCQPATIPDPGACAASGCGEGTLGDASTAVDAQAGETGAPSDASPSDVSPPDACVDVGGSCGSDVDCCGPGCIQVGANVCSCINRGGPGNVCSTK
jgi:hypothetical protein